MTKTPTEKLIGYVRQYMEGYREDVAMDGIVDALAALDAQAKADAELVMAKRLEADKWTCRESIWRRRSLELCESYADGAWEVYKVSSITGGSVHLRQLQTMGDLRLVVEALEGNP